MENRIERESLLAQEVLKENKAFINNYLDTVSEDSDIVFVISKLRDILLEIYYSKIKENNIKERSEFTLNLFFDYEFKVIELKIKEINNEK